MPKFWSAARRHFQDGETLRQQQRIDKLKQNAQLHFSGRGASKLAALLEDPTSFDAWRIEHRYEADGIVDQPRCTRHAEQARETLKLVQEFLGTTLAHRPSPLDGS
jgi:hypothetical protein